MNAITNNKPIEAKGIGEILRAVVMKFDFIPVDILWSEITSKKWDVNPTFPHLQ